MTETAPTSPGHAWLHSLASREPPPHSERLVRALEAHAAASAVDVAMCRQLAQRTDDPVVQLLVGIIVGDEQRQDSLLRSMIRGLQEDVEFVACPGAASVPNGWRLGTVEAADEMMASVRGLIRNEHEGSRHLRHLARQEPTLYNGLYPLLLETIARDSEKHATIMRYLLHRIETQAR